MKLLFEEKQYMRQWWLLAITLLPILIPVAINIFPSVGNTKSIASDTGIIIFNISMLTFAAIMFSGFYFAKLTTKIYEDRIEYGWNIPTKDLNILYWSDVEHTEYLKYGFVGGYGYRLFTKYGTVYNTRGDIGIQIVKKNGEKLLIGTNQPEALKSALEFLKSRSN
jgi:hypothetical protein